MKRLLIALLVLLMAVPALAGGPPFFANTNAGTATIADTTDTTTWCVFVDDQTGNTALKTNAGCTYNAATGMLTATGFTGPVTGNASTATALAANPTDCAANQYATTIAANGNLSCSAIASADLTTALASPPAIGGTTPAAGAFTTVTGTTGTFTGNLTGLVAPFVLTTAEGVHDGANDAAIMTDSGESFPVNGYVGMTLYNVTDGSSCTITANATTTMTCTLAGGTDNNWDTNDVWAVAPGPSQSGSMYYIGAATTILHPATAGYAACYYSTTAATIKVDPVSASMQIVLNGTALTAGNEIDSAGAAGDYICIHNWSAVLGVTLGRSGTWTDGGSS